LNKFVALAKASYQSEKLLRPDWTCDYSRPEGPLWLNKNENIDPILNEQIQKLIAKVKSYAINTYPELAKIYKKLALQEGLDPKNFLLTAGSDGAIRAVFDVFIAPGDKVLHTAPTFAMYDVYSKMYGADEISVGYEFGEKGPWFNFQGFLEKIESLRPKLVCLPNPDSPTGTVLTEDQVVSLLEVTLRCGSLLLIDEAYFPFYPKSVLSKMTEWQNLLVCRSFSKAWGAAGFRVGYLAGNESLIKLLHKSRPMYEVSTFSSELIYLLLDHREEVLASVARLEAGREFFVKAMRALEYTVTTSYGNFLHVNFGGDEAVVAEALKDTVLYRTDFNQASCLRGFSRFSLATEPQMKLIVDRIKSVKK
jgi:histidinol-phosphate aminotransferase